jgi:hypothetical protein
MAIIESSDPVKSFSKFLEKEIDLIDLLCGLALTMSYFPSKPNM